jgi:hypothetical protein
MLQVGATAEEEEDEEEEEEGGGGEGGGEEEEEKERIWYHEADWIILAQNRALSSELL